MPHFVVTGEEDEKLGPAVAAAYPNAHIKAWAGLYVVLDESAIAQQVSAKLGTPEGKLGRVFVGTIVGYSGWAPKNVWEWLAIKGTPHVPST